MSGSGRRSGSKWDLKEDVPPEMHRDISCSNKSREYMSGRRGFQRDGHMNEESMLGMEGDGNYKRRMSPGPNGWRQQNRSCSPRRSRGRPYRSRSKSRSRSPAHNRRREPDLNDRSSNRSRNSAPLCRDFAGGRCRKGDLCRFAHHGSPDLDGRRRSESRTGDGWESRHRDDGALRHHSDTYLTGGGSVHICNDFLKGRCNRGALCKFSHHDYGSDEFGKGSVDVSHGNGDSDWVSKSGSSYGGRAHIRSKPLCKSFVAGNCRYGEHCKFSHQREHVYPERKSPDDRQPEHNFNGANVVWNDLNRVDKTSLRNVPEARGWQVDRTDFIDPGKSRAGEWSGDDILNHELNDPTYMRGAATNGHEKPATNDKQSVQWNFTDISNSESKGTEKGLDDGKMPSPKVMFNPQMSLVSQKSDSLPVSQISLPTSEQGIAQRASAESHYISGIMQPNMSNDYLKPNPSSQMDIATDARNNGSSYANVNVPTDIPSGQGIHQIDGGFGAQPISSTGAVGQSNLTVPLHPPGRQNMQMPHLQTVHGTNLAIGQSQSTFPLHHVREGLQMPQHQPVFNSSQTEGLYMSNAAVSQAASGATLSQNSVLQEQLAQYSHLSATLAQLLEKRQHLPQLYAAIPLQTAMDGGSNLSNSSVTVSPVSAGVSQPNQASKPIRQYDPLRDSMDTKVANTSKELLPSAVEQRSSVLPASSVPSSDPKVGSSGDELLHKSDDLNVQGPVVVSKEENGQAIGKGVTETQEALDQGPTENVALDSGADDGKKAKDAKGIRQFKFALAEFVKELMKPTWKEGQMSKEVYKTIVKKVVDKVTDTIQVAQIPRTKEKIDQYLSFSRPKLSNLVQAYVEKYQKT